MADVQLTFAYEDTDFTRTYQLEIADSLQADAKGRIIEINNSLKSGTDDGLSDFFVSDNGERFTLISAAKFIVTTEEYINLAEGE